MIIDDSLWINLLKLKEERPDKNIQGWAYDGKSFHELRTNNNLTADLKAVLLISDNTLELDSQISQYEKIETPFEELLFFVKTTLSKNIVTILQNYWPLSVIGLLDRNLPYVFIHSAISLDGYLATASGHSRWIGNDENLTHSHRLRALFDAILVGSKTVVNDKPALNVRHVQGENPKRLILSNRCDDFSSLKNIVNCETILLRDSDFKYLDDANQFDKVLFFEGISQEDKMLDLLQKCKRENISSILIEGGGATISSFIEARVAQNIQFHISPLLFGSGIKAVKLPEVNMVNETHQLKNMSVTPIGNSFMVTASLS